jgi:hypothetical protein
MISNARTLPEEHWDDGAERRDPDPKGSGKLK